MSRPNEKSILSSRSAVSRFTLLTRLLNEVKTFHPDVYNIFITRKTFVGQIPTLLSFSFCLTIRPLFRTSKLASILVAFSLYCSKLPHSRCTRYKVPFISQYSTSSMRHVVLWFDCNDLDIR